MDDLPRAGRGRCGDPGRSARTGAAAAGLLAPPETEPRTETGLLAWIAPLRGGLWRHREGLQEALVFAGAAAGTYAAAIALVSVSFRPGHLAATCVASAVGAVATGCRARRGSAGARRPPGSRWLGGVLVLAAAFDVPEFANEARSAPTAGGRSSRRRRACSPACYAFQLLFPQPRAPAWPRRPASSRWPTFAAGIALISPPGDVLTSSWIGWRLVIPALVYFGLAARVFRIERHRDLSTCMWALGTGALLGAETLVVDGATWTVIAYAATATALALLAAPLREERLWWAGTAIVSATSAVVLAWFLPPSHFFAATAAPGAGLWVGLGCLGAGVVLLLTGAPQRRWIDPVLGVGALYLLSLGILELAQRLFGGSVETDFERGHVVVSVVWALIGLALLVAGLLRDERAAPLRRPRALRPQPGEDLPLRPERAQLGRAGAVLHRGRRTRARRRVLPAAAELAHRLAAAAHPVGRARLSPRAVLSVAGRVALRQHVVRPLPPLPVGDRRLARRRGGRTASARRAPSGARTASSSAGRPVARTRTTAAPRGTPRAADRPRRSRRCR